MNMKELREKNDADLAQFVAEKREELRKLRFGVAGSTMRNVHASKNLRREVAQALTEITRRNAETA
jgi:ribosomal protein L29